MSERRHEARKIHIRLTPELHQRLRIRCAERDTTIQDFVVDLLERALKPVREAEPPARRRRG